MRDDERSEHTLDELAASDLTEPLVFARRPQAGDDALLAEMFPADDPVAQFVIVTCAQRNDVAEAVRQLVDGVARDRSATHYFHRLIVSHLFEAFKWMRHARKSSREVTDWLAGVEDPVDRAHRDAVVGLAAETGLGKRILWSGRNATFHYPRLGVPQEGLTAAMRAVGAAKVQLSFEPDEGGTHTRYDFAETILDYRVFHTWGDDLRSTMREVQQAALRFVLFADSSLFRYIRERGFELGIHSE